MAQKLSNEWKDHHGQHASGRHVHSECHRRSLSLLWPIARRRPGALERKVRVVGSNTPRGPSLDISHYLCTIAEFCGAIGRFSGGAPPRGVRRRERNWNICGLRRQRRRGLGGPLDDAAFATRCGGAYQAGEPRAVAAAARRTAAQPQAWAAGQPDAIAILIRRTLMRMRAPILRSLRRMVPQLASVKGV